MNFDPGIERLPEDSQKLTSPNKQSPALGKIKRTFTPHNLFQQSSSPLSSSLNETQSPEYRNRFSLSSTPSEDKELIAPAEEFHSPSSARSSRAPLRAPDRPTSNMQKISPNGHTPPMISRIPSVQDTSSNDLKRLTKQHSRLLSAPLRSESCTLSFTDTPADEDDLDIPNIETPGSDYRSRSTSKLFGSSDSYPKRSSSSLQLTPISHSFTEEDFDPDLSDNDSPSNPTELLRAAQLQNEKGFQRLARKPSSHRESLNRPASRAQQLTPLSANTSRSGRTSSNTQLGSLTPLDFSRLPTPGLDYPPIDSEDSSSTDQGRSLFGSITPSTLMSRSSSAYSKVFHKTPSQKQLFITPFESDITPKESFQSLGESSLDKTLAEKELTTLPAPPSEVMNTPPRAATYLLKPTPTKPTPTKAEDIMPVVDINPEGKRRVIPFRMKLEEMADATKSCISKCIPKNFEELGSALKNTSDTADYIAGTIAATAGGSGGVGIIEGALDLKEAIQNGNYVKAGGTLTKGIGDGVSFGTNIATLANATAATALVASGPIGTAIGLGVLTLSEGIEAYKDHQFHKDFIKTIKDTGIRDFLKRHLKLTEEEIERPIKEIISLMQQKKATFAKRTNEEILNAALALMASPNSASDSEWIELAKNIEQQSYENQVRGCLNTGLGVMNTAAVALSPLSSGITVLVAGGITLGYALADGQNGYIVKKVSSFCWNRSEMGRNGDEILMHMTIERDEEGTPRRLGKTQIIELDEEGTPRLPGCPSIKTIVEANKAILAFTAGLEQAKRQESTALEEREAKQAAYSRNKLPPPRLR